MGIEHENTILELKEKNQKLKRKLAAAEEDVADKAEEAKNLAVRLVVRTLRCVSYSGPQANDCLRIIVHSVAIIQAVESAWEAARGQNKTALHQLKKKCVTATA